jgi:hypothetical protein
MMSMTSSRRRLVVSMSAFVLASVPLLGREAASPDDRSNASSSCGTLGLRERLHCYSEQFYGLFRRGSDPAAALAEVKRIAYGPSGPGNDCHLIMHTVGRRYASTQGVTLGTLMEYLPRDNDPGCSAGFAHGLITGVAQRTNLADPQAAVSVCERVGTRYQRYSCVHGLGHAFMRGNGEALEPALALCSGLGPSKAADCAQGAYHDYWFSVVGWDDTVGTPEPKTPKALCAVQPSSFVLPCWYRALIETRPSGYQTKTPADLLRHCGDLAGLQREGCMTAASVIGSANPLEQFSVCSQLGGADIVSCLHGVKVQNLMDLPRVNQLRLIQRCDRFDRGTATACFEWFGKMLSVITNGGFEAWGCPMLKEAAARDACVRGAKRMDEALVTFS